MPWLKNIEWEDKTRNTILHKIDCRKNHINKGSRLTVRESQVAIFSTNGKMADVFTPGVYTLDTNSLPIITKMMSWKYGFQNPFQSEVYYVITRQFINENWGTSSRVTIRDKDFGAISFGGFGKYAFQVDDAGVFLQQVAGTFGTYKTEDVAAYLRSKIVGAMSDAVGQSKVPFLDLAGNLREFGKIVQFELAEDFAQLGLKLTNFIIENLSLDPAGQAALAKYTEANMMRGGMDVHMGMATAEALKSAAKNPGQGSTMMNMGMGLGMGVPLGNTMGRAFSQNIQQNEMKPKTAPPAKQAAEPTITCKKCGYKAMKANAKFCPECGTAAGNTCSKCKAVVKDGAKFCHECGTSMTPTCSKCKAPLKPGAKFCAECGTAV